MPSLNKVIIAGNITRAPEITYTPKGTAIGKLSVAVNRTWLTETGEKKEEVTYVDVTYFGKRAETIAQFFHKGSPIIVDGRLRLDQWEDKQTGEKRQRLCVVGEGFSFCGSNAPAKAPQGKGAPKAPASEADAAAAEAEAAAAGADDVPF